ncbi:MBL fold metallo-hydrolase [Mesorhizobium sp. L-8-3]|uniref:MBL fold metallo-hydrolase n=1 Tax=Mesorhizobium sp. L-8-3 TaxID=2744522 RepID=UPI001927C06D|nr:MBL fold metallo-hydrolase [Mesorhizobium sp. L-8-3]BCH22224.1 membrane protein [Mesorhizobium sp. L-8-3]
MKPLAGNVTRTKRRNPYFQGDVSDHFDGRVFFNPGGRPPAGFADLLRWQLGGERTPWPASWPSPFPSARPDARVAGDELRVTMVGHSTVLIQFAGLNMLTDPVWSERVSPFSFAGPKRVNEPGIAFDDLPPIDLVLLSHNHYDHMDAATLKKLRAGHDPLVVTPLGNDAILDAAAPSLRVVARDWGETLAVTDRVTIHVEPAHHWSARGAADRRMALWGGFVVEAPAGKLYFAGDTGFHGGSIYRRLGQKHGGFRLAVLPIGAYAPRWFMEPHHQDPDEAAEGMLLCKAAWAVGCHWGTFPLTNEPIEEPRDRLWRALEARNIGRECFRPMLPGEVWDVPAP